MSWHRFMTGLGAGAGRPIHHIRRACGPRGARLRCAPPKVAPRATGPPTVCVHGVGGGRAGPRANTEQIREEAVENDPCSIP
eukprot:scaffold77871_cov62-Phaeocystis_antarctica.AAC.1